MRSLLLLSVLVAGCGPSVAAVRDVPATPKPDSAKAAAMTKPTDWSGGPLPPGMTPRGWIVTLTSTVPMVNGGRMVVYRDPRTPDSSPAGETSGDTPGGQCSVFCSATQSRVSFQAGIGQGAVTGIGFASGGTSFTASGNAVSSGITIGTFTAVVTAVP